MRAFTSAIIGFVLALAPLAVVSAPALERALTPQETQLIQQINEHNSAIRTMAGRFQQINSQGKRTEGTFYLDRPNRIAFRYAPPSRESIVSVGRGFYILNRREKTTKAYPQDQIPLRQFLKDRIDLFSANIRDVVTTDTNVSVTISDNTAIGVVDVALVFDRASKDLVQWTLTEPSGAELTFSLFDVVKNKTIPKAMFYIDPTYRSLNAQ